MAFWQDSEIITPEIVDRSQDFSALEQKLKFMEDKHKVRKPL